MQLTNIKLGIGIPLSWPFIPAPFFDSFVAMEKPIYEYIRSNNGPIDAMRNDLVNMAKMAGCTHLVMMDSDMIYHPKTIARLLSHRLPIVGALCYRRYPPFDPLMYKGKLNEFKTVEEWEPDSLVEVDATGTGCLMIDMDIFNNMAEPWFEFVENPDKERGGIIGEDFYFCHKLREAGYQIYVDTSVPSGHLCLFEVTRETWLMNKYIQKIKERRDEDGKESR